MIVYLKNINDFQNEISTGTTYVDFYADWCNPCRMLGQIFEELDEKNPDLKVLKVNVDTFPELASKYGVYSIPQVNIFKNGQEVDKFIGYRGSQELQEIIDQNK